MFYIPMAHLIARIILLAAVDRAGELDDTAKQLCSMLSGVMMCSKSVPLRKTFKYEYIRLRTIDTMFTGSLVFWRSITLKSRIIAIKLKDYGSIW